MLARISFIFKYWLSWILIFQLGRLLFLLFNKTEAAKAGVYQNLGSAWHGLRMDLSMAAYITIPVLLFLCIGFWIRNFSKPFLFKFYTAVILFFILLATAVDVNAYHAWGNRLDAGILKYLSNPKEAYASVENLPLFWMLLALLMAWLLSVKLFSIFLHRQISRLPLSGNKVIHSIILLLLGAAFIIPVRGGLQLAPLNQSSVYFSQNNFSNLAAINAPWNFLYTLNHHTNESANPFMYMQDAAAHKIVDSLYHYQEVQNAVVAKQNVMVLVWESFTEKAIHISKNGMEVTPGFNQLRQEGLYFSNIYASGDRTDKGIVAVLSGYPAQPTTSIVKVASKAAKLPSLSKTFGNAGYNTSFYYGGELEFANMKAYLLADAFQQYITVNDFSKNELNSKWGAHDGVLAQRLKNDITTKKQPFFCTWLTLSSHEPFETPVPTVIEGKDDESKFLNSLHYTDAVIFDFVQFCKKQSWWNNTLIIIVADHGHRMPVSGKKNNDFKIPMLLLGGNIPPGQNNLVGSQTDLAATLLNYCGIDSKSFTWSRNLSGKNYIPSAYFSFNNGFGAVNQSGWYIFDNVGKILIDRGGEADTSLLQAGKAIQQLSYGDYLNK